MFIQVQETPNPQTMKFMPGITILEQGTLSIAKGDDEAVSPLADAILQVEGAIGVFLSGDFISVTKEPDYDWEMLKPLILTTVMDHFMAGKPILAPQKRQPTADETSNVEDSEIVAQIKEIIETRVRPAVAQDGGDIIFNNFEDGIVYLEMHGSCSGCPSSMITLKNGIENMLQHYIPEVRAVESV